MRYSKEVSAIFMAFFTSMNLLLVIGTSSVFIKNISVLSGLSLALALVLSLPVRNIINNINSLDEFMFKFLRKNKTKISLSLIIFAFSSLSFAFGYNYPLSGLINISFQTSAQAFIPLKLFYSGFSETLGSIIFNYSRFYLHFLWIYVFTGFSIGIARKIHGFPNEDNSNLDASILPFTGEKTGDINVEIYVVTGKHGGLRIPEDFCKECNMFVHAVEEAAEETDKDVDIQIKSYWTRFLRPVLKGGLHPPVMLIDNELYSQGYAVPDKDDLAERLREL